MTLRERFKQWLDTDPREQIREVPLEIIADEFAIGFAEWLEKLHWEIYYNTAAKELLEIYKKEKEL